MMKKSEVLELNKALSNMVKVGLDGVRFSYAVTKNFNILKPEIEALQKVLEYSEDYKVYENSRLELIKKYAKFDDQNKPIMKALTSEISEFVLKEDQVDLFTKEFEKLKEEHKLTLIAREKQVKDYEELLKDEIDIELYKIQLSTIPETMSKYVPFLFPIIFDEI